MASSAIPPSLENLVRLVSGNLIHLSVDKRGFMSLPKRLQGVTQDITGDMIEVLKVTAASTQDIFVFTTLHRSIAASEKLNVDPRYNSQRFMTVSVTPLHLLKKISHESHSTLTVDYGFPEEMVLHYQDYGLLEKLLLVSHLARLEQFYVAHSSQRIPISVEIDEKHYAAAFMTVVDSHKSMETLREEDPGAVLLKVSPRKFADSVLDRWGLDGAVMNLATRSESFLEKTDIRTLQMVMGLLNPSFFSFDRLKQFVKRVMTPPVKDPRRDPTVQAAAAVVAPPVPEPPPAEAPAEKTE